MSWDAHTQLHVIHQAPACAPRIGCMGGGCAAGQRDQCAHYRRTDARNLSERLCIAGRADEFQRLGGAIQTIPENA